MFSPLSVGSGQIVFSLFAFISEYMVARLLQVDLNKICFPEEVIGYYKVGSVTTNYVSSTIFDDTVSDFKIKYNLKFNRVLRAVAVNELA